MDIPRNWRLQNQRYRLIGTQCDNCKQNAFPPELICSNCKSDNMSNFRFSGRGKVYSFTVMYQSAEMFVPYLPFAVALIDLEEGARISAQLTDVDVNAVEIGMEVEMVVRKISEEGEKGLINYSYKFRPKMQFQT